MKHSKKLRKWTILVLMLVLLCNMVRAQASTTTISVRSYDEFVAAIEQADNMDTIVLTSFMEVPKGSVLGDSSKQIVLKFGKNGYIEFAPDNSFSTVSTVQNIVFDGDVKTSLAPLVRATGKIDFINCKFMKANAGAVGAGYAELTFTDCTFSSNVGSYGGHFNTGSNTTAIFDNCTIRYGTATVRGGGIYVDSATSYVTLKNCIVTANESVYGGGIYNDGNLILKNTLLYNNHATTGGDDLCTSTTTYDLGSLDDMEQAFKDRNITIKPLSWEQSVNEDDGKEFYRLLYVSSATDPEDTDQDPDNEGTSEEEPDTTEPNEGEDTEKENTDPSNPNTPPSGDSTVPDTDPDDEGKEDNTDADDKDSEIKPTDPSDSNEAGTGEDENNSTREDKVTNNDTTSNSTTDNSITNHTEDYSGSGNTTNNNNYYSTTTNKTMQNPDTNNSTYRQNTDSSSYSGDHSSSTVNNYTQPEAVDEAYEGMQPINVEVPVTITVPEQDETSQNSYNWVDIVTMVFLAVLVLGEIKDRIRKE